jgi:uncharacterized protein (TIGR02300 family)
MKAARGTKRVCQSCGNKFYDLNRDPITCPICQAVFQNQEVRPKAALAGNAAEEEEEALAVPAGGVEIVSLEEVAADESELPDIEGDELIDEEAADLDDEDETFIEVEDDDGDDEVSGLVGGSREEDDEV